MSQVIFSNNLNLDIGLIIIVFALSIITTIGGVGGGGLLIPTFILIGQFKIEEAIPLSIITILGDTFVRVCFLVNRRHPMNKNRYLIDMTPALLLVPFDGNTSFIGLILSEISPIIIVMILIIVTLGVTFYKSISKAVNSFLRENEYLENNNMEMIVIDGIAEYFALPTIEDALVDDNQVGDKYYNQIFKISLQFFSILIVAVFSITRKLIDKCSVFFWLQIVLQFISVGFIGFAVIKYVEYDYAKKRESNYVFLEGDIVWNKENIIKFVLIASFTGMLSTYMGIGGGMLITPIMIQVGMIPEVVVATSAISTLFSSLISTINYVIEGKLLWSYGIAFSISSGLGSIIGLKLSDYILNKFKRQSIIIFIVSMILFTSIILLVVNSVTNKEINNMSFKNYCKN
tara:strand:- start:400 stop:1605 length:1206 start_codon:yes stop_codon:yes gene_type:complete